MAGHSKWANIRFRKSVQDAKRGKLFTKYIREITVAARMGGADRESNPRLRAAIDKALTANMTRDTIDRAIKRGAIGQEGQDLEEIRYEGYATGGIAVMVDCLSNNRNRTVSEVRHLFSKFGGNLGTDGSVSYLFSKRGHLVFASGIEEDKILEAALELGAEDIQFDEEGVCEVFTDFESYLNIKTALTKQGFICERSEMSMIPATIVTIENKEQAEKFTKFIDALEDLEDVQAVYSNADMSENVLEQLGYKGLATSGS